MAAVEITISGVLYDKYNRTTQNVVLIGEANLTGLQIGGGPIYPPLGPVDPGYGKPPPTWGGGRPDFPPVDPGYGQPPPTWGGRPGGDFPPHPAHPIVLPPELPPGTVPTPPNPGDPTTPLPVPPGSGGWPVQGIVPPPFIVVNYPGIGPIVVPPPAQNATTPPPSS